jgi:nucleoside-diphosphate-sugar epimerase
MATTTPRIVVAGAGTAGNPLTAALAGRDDLELVGLDRGAAGPCLDAAVQPVVGALRTGEPAVRHRRNRLYSDIPVLRA